MSLDYQSLLYDPNYNIFGVDASLQPGTGEAEVVGLTVIDKTQGALVQDAMRIGVETVKPACTVRAKEIIAAGLGLQNLAGGTVQFNSKTWRIDGVRPLPSPKGEGDGEFMLILSEEAP